MSSIYKNLFDDLFNESYEEYDLNTDEGYKKFNDDLNKIKEDKEANLLLKLFDIDLDKMLDDMSIIADKIHNQSKKENEEKNKQIEKKQEVKKEQKSNFVRPSSLLSYDHQLQLHKLVNEYVETMIKPYNNDTLTDKQINDAYAGLYEFAAWVMNK